MNTSLKIGGGIAAACAACCAVSAAPAFIAGAGLTAIGSAAWLWGGRLAALGSLGIGAALYLAHRKFGNGAHSATALIASARQQGCGCSSNSSAHKMPIACTLGAEDFRQRSDDIRDLARRSLCEARRSPLSLTLAYAPEVLEEVHELMAKEQECCPFLAFDLKQTPDAVELTIVAPASAREAADLLFDHFAPHLAASKNKEIV